MPASISQESSVWTYYSFLLFEICCGLFFPTFGTLRSTYIPEETRVSVMNLFRIPLNFIVILALLQVEKMSTTWVLRVCCGLHIIALICAFKFQAIKDAEKFKEKSK